MSTVVRRICFIGLVHALSLATVFAASMCFAQDKRQPDATKGEDDIKQLISTYAKAADEADPTLASRVWCNSSEDSLVKAD